MIRLESHHLNKVTHVHSSVAPFSVCPHAYLILCRYEYPTIKKVYLNKHGSLYKVAFIASPSYGHPFKMCMMWLHQAFNRNRAVGKCQKSLALEWHLVKMTSYQCSGGGQRMLNCQGHIQFVHHCMLCA